LPPDFLQQHPFFGPASRKWRNLYTVRGLPLEFGDQHIYALPTPFITGVRKVSANEKLPSMNWPGYGIGILRVGGPGHRQELFMTYDRVSLHGASDKLAIECWVDGVPVMREGGYANPSTYAYLGESQPGIKEFLALPYPRKVFDVTRRPENPMDAWRWAHSHMAHNTVRVNEIGRALPWGGHEGFGELIIYKGGEAAGTPGANFQVLDCQDRDSFDRMGVPVPEFRRTLLAVEGPDGRPYAVDIIRLTGGQRVSGDGGATIRR